MADLNVERRPQNRGLFRERNAFLNPSSRFPTDLFTMSPFTLMRRLSEDMDRMFTGWGGAGAQETSGWAPPIEVTEKDGTLKVSAELPGLDKDNVKVEINDDGLVIRGERKREWEHDDKGVHRSERYYGSFYRAIPLPDGALTDKAKAEFNNGILEVEVPISESKQRNRQIPIGSVGTEANRQTQTTKAG
jgi:HSP20 family protein